MRKFLFFICIIFTMLSLIVNREYKEQKGGQIIDISKIEYKQIPEINLKENIDELKEVVEKANPISLGEFKLTAYCPCEKCCGIWATNRQNGVVGSTGQKLEPKYSIAVDPKVIPYGTEVIINGNTYKAQDCGGAIKGNRIDIYMGTHEEALEFGVQYAEVFSKGELKWN